MTNGNDSKQKHTMTTIHKKSGTNLTASPTKDKPKMI